MTNNLLKSFLVVLTLLTTFVVDVKFKVTGSDFDTGIPFSGIKESTTASVAWPLVASGACICHTVLGTRDSTCF